MRAILFLVLLAVVGATQQAADLCVDEFNFVFNTASDDVKCSLITKLVDCLDIALADVNAASHQKYWDAVLTANTAAACDQGPIPAIDTDENGITVDVPNTENALFQRFRRDVISLYDVSQKVHTLQNKATNCLHKTRVTEVTDSMTKLAAFSALKSSVASVQSADDQVNDAVQSQAAQYDQVSKSYFESTSGSVANLRETASECVSSDVLTGIVSEVNTGFTAVQTDGTNRVNSLNSQVQTTINRIKPKLDAIKSALDAYVTLRKQEIATLTSQLQAAVDAKKANAFNPAKSAYVTESARVSTLTGRNAVNKADLTPISTAAQADAQKSKQFWSGYATSSYCCGTYRYYLHYTEVDKSQGAFTIESQQQFRVVLPGYYRVSTQVMTYLCCGTQYWYLYVNGNQVGRNQVQPYTGYYEYYYFMDVTWYMKANDYFFVNLYSSYYGYYGSDTAGNYGRIQVEYLGS